MRTTTKKTRNKKTLRSKNNSRKLISLTFFVTAIGVLLYIVITQYITRTTPITGDTESYAAGKNTTSSDPLLIEAEDMSYLSSPDGIQIIDDPTASSGKAKLLSINNAILTSVTTSSTVNTILVSAKGKSCHGGPNMIVNIGGMNVFDKKVSSSSWNDYSARVNVSPGTHTLTITFTNDFSSNSGPGCNRDLLIDKISFQ